MRRAGVALVDSEGRLVLPDWLRRRLGLRPGQRLEVRIEEGRLVLEPVKGGIRARDLLGAAGVEEVDLEEVEGALGGTS